MSKAFKEDAGLLLCKFPPAFVKSGSFVHDIALKEKDWQPSQQDFRALSLEMSKIGLSDTKIERLEVQHEIAKQIFKENPFKTEQLPTILSHFNGIVPLYRVGDHIDISSGPMMSSTRFIGSVKIVASHKLSDDNDTSNMYRVQGIALPAGFSVSAFAFSNILVPRAMKLVRNFNTQMRS